MDVVDFLLSRGAVKFGQFRLKSGRISPYFVNASVIHDGEGTTLFAKFFADKIHEVFGNNFDVIFGPAYKGIPLSVAISMVLFERYGINCEWAFNRKEVKTYGDGGEVVGAELKGKRVVVVDDVITTGGTKEETLKLVKALGGEVIGIVIAVDRQERGERESALVEFSKKIGVPVYALCTITELFSRGDFDPKITQLFEEYRSIYGA